jgi:hypothetical protein
LTHAVAVTKLPVFVFTRRPYTDSRLIDPIQARIGRDAVDFVGDLLASLGLWPFTSHLGWAVAQFDYLIQQVREELQDVELKLYLPM